LEAKCQCRGVESRLQGDSGGYAQAKSLGDLAKEGKSGVQVAQELAVEARTVYEWLRQYQEKGLSGLMPQSRPGRKPKALLEREEFQQRIREGKYASLLRIQQVLKEEYAADYSVSGTWALLERFDIGWKVGRRIHPSADMAAQEAFKKTV